MPRWSKTNKLFEEQLAPSLSGRFKMRATGYHHAHDGENRFWFEFDGREIASFSFSGSCAQIRRRVAEAHSDLGDWEHRASHPNLEDRYNEVWRVEAAGARARGEVGSAVFTSDLSVYFQLSLPEVITSPSAIIRALGMVDRRLGKRRLRAMMAGPEDLSPLVRRFLAIRCEAEGLRPPGDAVSSA